MHRVYQRQNKPVEDIIDVLMEMRCYEVTVQCPDCHTIETLEFIKGRPLVFGKWRGVQDLFGVAFYHSRCEHPAKVLRWS